MKALLMHRDRDLDLAAPLPAQAETLRQDLDLRTLAEAMSGGDELLRNIADRVLLGGFGIDVDTVFYRQEMLKDALAHPQTVRAVHALALEAIERKRKQYFGFLANYPQAVLRGSAQILEEFIDVIVRLRALADKEGPLFRSEGYVQFFVMLRAEFDDDYVERMRAHLRQVRSDRGVLLSAGLGEANAGTGYVLRLPKAGPSWLDRLLMRAPPVYTFHIAERDDAGAQTLTEMQDRGINEVGNALAQSMDHMLSFFEQVRDEVGFQVAALNLHERLSAIGVRTSFPEPTLAGTRHQRFTGLVEPCLGLHIGRAPVANDADVEGKSLVIVTGANQGGKSSFLRSVAIAQLMMQAGLFVAAEAFSADLCSGVHTHYKREEDATMKSGKLDEELARMSAIADSIAPDALLLFNESFSSTNEREGSELARQITSAMLERHIKVWFVTHQYDFAHGWYVQRRADTLFLRADREPDGSRSFRLREGEPLATSWGEDLYKEIFGEERVVAAT